ncbi:MAG: hypothetical protein IKV58_00965 [Oscillospiraceae bacterium]|nr:hypothetical protein [Oscillospiraceae bacterium]
MQISKPLKTVVIVVAVIVSFYILITNSHTDIESFALVSGIAIDKNSDGYKVGVEILNAYEQNGEQRTIVLEATAPELLQAIVGIEQKCSKPLSFSHCSLMLMNKSFAKENDFANRLQSLINKKKIDSTCNLVIAQNACNVLKKDNGIYPIASYDIVELIKSNRTAGESQKDSQYFKVSNNLLQSKKVILPCIALSGENAVTNGYFEISAQYDTKGNTYEE